MYYIPTTGLLALKLNLMYFRLQSYISFYNYVLNFILKLVKSFLNKSDVVFMLSGVPLVSF
jgi:hypothetical protein